MHETVKGLSEAAPNCLIAHVTVRSRGYVAIREVDTSADILHTSDRPALCLVIRGLSVSFSARRHNFVDDRLSTGPCT